MKNLIRTYPQDCAVSAHDLVELTKLILENFFELMKFTVRNKEL